MRVVDDMVIIVWNMMMMRIKNREFKMINGVIVLILYIKFMFLCIKREFYEVFLLMKCV